MLRNYLTIAIRNLLRHRLFAGINLFGLATSMWVGLLVLMMVWEQFSLDQFHPHADRIFRFTSEVTNQQGQRHHLASAPLPLAPALQADYDLVSHAARLYPVLNGKARTAEKELLIKGAFTEPAFFEVLGFTLKAGNARTALASPHTIVLSEETALRFFGKQNSIGKVLSFDQLGDFQVTGIMQTPPGKSHLQFEAYASLASVPALEQKGKLKAVLNQWNEAWAGYTYVLLKENTPVSQLSAALDQIAALVMQQAPERGATRLGFAIQPLSSITPSRYLDNEIGRGATWGMVLAEMGLAFIILLSACFNYTNLTIARSLSRAKEVGIRKVMGASRSQLFAQFITESLLLSLLALFVANQLLSLWGQSPFLVEMLPKMDTNFPLLIAFLLFGLVVGLMAGALPAWLLSSFQPVQALKQLAAVKLFGGAFLRKSLIVIQFSISLVLTIFLVAIYQQFAYMTTADYGFRSDGILTVPLQGSDHRVLANEFRQISGVERVSATSTNLGKAVTGTTSLGTGKSGESMSINFYFVDTSFVHNMGLLLLAGSYSDRRVPGVSSSDGVERQVLLNETAIHWLGWKHPADAIGRRLWLADSLEVEIRGVVKDFHYQSMAIPIAPLAFRFPQQGFSYLNVKINTDTPTATIAQMQQVWKKLHPHQPFEYRWFTEELYDQREANSTVSTVAFLALLAISIACLGLLGMVTYTVETRRKEVGIRKVMGASVRNIVSLLSSQFVRLICLAGLIALPIGYAASAFFLYNFAYRVSFGVGSLLTCFGFLLLIGGLTISTLVYRAATANPVKSLRTE